MLLPWPLVDGISRFNARNASSISASENCRGLFLLLVELFLLFGSDCMCWNHCIMLITLTLTLNINWNIDSVGAMSSNQCFLGKFDGTWIIT